MKPNKKVTNVVSLLILSMIISTCAEPTKPNETPSVTISSGPSGKINTDEATFLWYGSDSDGSISGYYYDLDDSTPDNFTTSTSHTYSNLSEGSHTFYVKAKDDKGDVSEIVSRSFEVVLIPAAPTLSSPSNGSTISDDTPYFNWNDPTYAAGYHLQVDDYTSFSTPVIEQTNLSSSNYTTPSSSSLSNDTYYWRVRAKNSSGTWGDWSSTWSFTVSVSETGWLEITFSGSDIISQTNISEYYDVNSVYVTGGGNAAVSDPDYNDCSGNVLDIDTGFLNEWTYFYPADQDYGSNGLVIPGEVTSITFEVTADNEYYYTENDGGAAVSTSKFPCNLSGWLAWNHTYCGTGSITLNESCLEYGEPFELRVGNWDASNFSDYNVGIKKVKYIFNGWIVPGGSLVSSSSPQIIILHQENE